VSDAADAWKRRWKVLIECRDCGSAWECTSPSLSLERVSGFNRMFVAGGPETCPECKNLKAVPTPPPAEGKG
jgi:hypothetical protein